MDLDLLEKNEFKNKRTRKIFTANNHKRYIVIFTDAYPSGEGDNNGADDQQDRFNQLDADALDVLAAKCVANDITCFVLGGGVDKSFIPTGGSLYYPWQKFAIDTGGTTDPVDEAGSETYSSTVVNILTTLCD